MTTFHPLGFWQMAAVLVAVLFPEIAGAQAPANQGNLTVGRRHVVFKSVVAVRGKSSDENRIVVLATGQPATADVLEKVKDKDAEDNANDEANQAYLKTVFQEDGSLRCLVGMGVGTSFAKRGSRWKARPRSPTGAFAAR